MEICCTAKSHDSLLQLQHLFNIEYFKSYALNSSIKLLCSQICLHESALAQFSLRRCSSADLSVIFTLKRARNFLSYVAQSLAQPFQKGNANVKFTFLYAVWKCCEVPKTHSSFSCKCNSENSNSFQYLKTFIFHLFAFFSTNFLCLFTDVWAIFFHPHESLAYSLSCVCSAQLIWITNIKIEFLLVLTCFPCYFPSLFSQI